MNIFIAGLNYNMSEAELGELFAEYGEVVSVKIIMSALNSASLSIIN